MLDTIAGPGLHPRVRRTPDGTRARLIWGLEWAWTIYEAPELHVREQSLSRVQVRAPENSATSPLAEYQIILLTEDPSLNWKLGAQNEYETDIEPGDKKNDLRYYMALGVDW